MNIFKFKFILILFTSLILSSCTETFYPKIDENTSVLVVDGKITNEIGSCEIRLFRTVKFTDEFSLKPEIDAMVFLHNDQGETEVLSEIEPGIYKSTSNLIQGKVGHSYWIEIQTLSDEKFESTPELMPSAFEINSLYGEEIEVIKEDGSKEKGVGIYFDATNQNNQENFLRWEYKESYRWDSPFIVEDKYSDKPATTCYPLNEFPLINIYNATDLSKKKVKHLSVATILQHEVKLEHEYLLDMNLYSISSESYQFWKKMKAIHQSNGNLYDVIPANIQGNITACESDCEVLGYFEVSSVRKKQKFFSKSEFSIKFSDFDKECEKFMKRQELKPPLPPPPPNIYKIIASYQENTEMVYIVRWRYCYECNVKYPINKPSFWPFTN
jgi:hypothetical protein